MLLFLWKIQYSLGCDSTGLLFLSCVLLPPTIDSTKISYTGQSNFRTRLCYCLLMKFLLSPNSFMASGRKQNTMQWADFSFPHYQPSSPNRSNMSDAFWMLLFRCVVDAGVAGVCGWLGRVPRLGWNWERMLEAESGVPLVGIPALLTLWNSKFIHRIPEGTASYEIQKNK